MASPVPASSPGAPSDPGPWSISEEKIHVELTYKHLSIAEVIDRVRSPGAGAIVLFAGTTRSLPPHPTLHLTYTAYPRLALRTLHAIAAHALAAHALSGISLTHRLGAVPVGEESILVAVAAAHRRAAWCAGEEALEECKRRVEVWKLETFGGEGPAAGVWRSNRDGERGVRVDGEGDGEGNGEGEEGVEG